MKEGKTEKLLFWWSTEKMAAGLYDWKHWFIIEWFKVEYWRPRAAGSDLFSTPSEQQIFCFAFFHISSRSFFENHAVLKKFTTHAIFVTSAPIATPQFPASTPSM